MLALVALLAGCGGDIIDSLPGQDGMGNDQGDDPGGSDGSSSDGDNTSDGSGWNDGSNSDESWGDGPSDGGDGSSSDGSTDGSNDGAMDGSSDGAMDGSSDGATDGSSDGSTDGSSDGSSSDGGDDSGNPSDDPHQRCVDRINELRATVGLGPLQRWTEAESCSDDQSKRDLEGAGAHGSFGQCMEFGQNTCPGWGGGVDGVIGGCLDAMWSEGPPPTNPCDGDCFQMHGHYMNMTNADYTRVACGFYTSPDGKTWSNQNFR